jgi:hypothetical protein
VALLFEISRENAKRFNPLESCTWEADSPGVLAAFGFASEGPDFGSCTCLSEHPIYRVDAINDGEGRPGVHEGRDLVGRRVFKTNFAPRFNRLIRVRYDDLDTRTWIQLVKRIPRKLNGNHIHATK